MTNEEFSNEFDTLINQSAPSENFGEQVSPLKFDEYEKSVFLTQAQEEVALGLYNGKLSGDSFEKTEALRRYLVDLVRTYEPETQVDGDGSDGLTKKSCFFEIPYDTWFITYESAMSNDEKLGCAKGSELEVIPVTQDELHRILRNPFRRPNKRKVLRLDIEGSKVELISEFNIDKYLIRYLKRPDPIILVDLPDGLTINKEKKATECKLNPAIHKVILEMAVSLALKSRTSAGK